MFGTDNHLFMHERPEITILGGIITTRHGDQCWHWHPTMFMEFCRQGWDVTSKWIEQYEPIMLDGGNVH